jgi:hypothetical protein
MAITKGIVTREHDAINISREMLKEFRSSMNQLGDNFLW